MKTVIIIRKDLLNELPLGKWIAQVVHAALGSGLSYQGSSDTSHVCAVCVVRNEKKLLSTKKEMEEKGLPTYLQVDAGKNHIDPGTPTVLCIGPDEQQKIDEATARFQTLKSEHSYIPTANKIPLIENWLKNDGLAVDIYSTDDNKFEAFAYRTTKGAAFNGHAEASTIIDAMFQAIANNPNEKKEAAMLKNTEITYDDYEVFWREVEDVEVPGFYFFHRKDDLSNPFLNCCVEVFAARDGMFFLESDTCTTKVYLRGLDNECIFLGPLPSPPHDEL